MGMLVAIAFLILAMSFAIRIVLPGRIGQIAIEILLRNLVLFLLRGFFLLLALPFRLLFSAARVGARCSQQCRPRRFHQHGPNYHRRRRRRN